MAKAPGRALPGCYELECEKWPGAENPVAKRARRKRKGHVRVRRKKKAKMYF